MPFINRIERECLSSRPWQQFFFRICAQSRLYAGTPKAWSRPRRWLCLSGPALPKMKHSYPHTRMKMHNKRCLTLDAWRADPRRPARMQARSHSGLEFALCYCFAIQVLPVLLCSYRKYRHRECILVLILLWLSRSWWTCVAQKAILRKGKPLAYSLRENHGIPEKSAQARLLICHSMLEASAKYCHSSQIPLFLSRWKWHSTCNSLPPFAVSAGESNNWKGAPLGVGVLQVTKFLRRAK